MQKRSNGSSEGIVRYIVNDKHVTQPFGYCECRYKSPAPPSASNRDEVSSMRYKRSLSSHSRSKRHLTSNLFVPNLDDQFDLFHSFDRPGRNGDFSGLGSGDRHSPFVFEPPKLDQDSFPLPEDRVRTIPNLKQPHSNPHRGIVQPPSHRHRVDYKRNNLRKSKRLHYSETDFVVSPSHDHDHMKPLPDFHHHENPDRSRVSPESVTSPSPVHRKPLPDFIHHEHPDRNRVSSESVANPSHHNHPVVATPSLDKRKPLPDHLDSEPKPPQNCKHVDASKLLSRIQADYFVCCDECRKKIIKKYANEGCEECSKSSDPIDVPKTICKKHESKENLSKKCRCNHNKTIFENLKKISEKLYELSEARERMQKKKQIESSSDVKQNLLQQLKKIYEKLSGLNSEDEVTISPKKRKEGRRSKCTKNSKRPSNKKKH